MKTDIYEISYLCWYFGLDNDEMWSMIASNDVDLDVLKGDKKCH